MVSDLAEIRDRLQRNAEAAAKDLLPAGKRQGGEWYCSGSNSPLGYAVGVVLRGSKRGVVGFFGGSRSGGDILTLAVECHNGDFKAACDWARLFLGMRAFDPKAGAPDRVYVPRQPDPKKLADERRYKENRIEKAIKIWNRGVPIAGTPAELYLLNRGLERSDWPVTLRYVEALEWELGAIYKGDKWVGPGPNHPALIACLQNVDRQKTGVWRIFITPDGQKAPLEQVKVGMGSPIGSCVRLGPATEELDIGEGLETSLGLVQLNRENGYERSVWSALSTSGMMNLVVPKGVRIVRIYPDGDTGHRNKKNPDGPRLPPAGPKAALRLQERLLSEDIDARVMPYAAKKDHLDNINSTD